MLGQTLNHSVEFCKFVQCHTFVSYKLFNLLLLNLIQIFNCHDNGTVLKPSFILWHSFIRVSLIVSDTNTAAEKYSRICINLFIIRIHNMG
jgi:hypothetical protein